MSEKQAKRKRRHSAAETEAALDTVIVETAKALTKPARPPRPLTHLERVQQDPKLQKLALATAAATMAAIPMVKSASRLWVEWQVGRILKNHRATLPKSTVRFLVSAQTSLMRAIAAEHNSGKVAP